LEKSNLWGRGVFILSLDVLKAFDRIKLGAVVRVVEKYKVPMRVRYAVMKELLANRRLSFRFCGKATRYIDILRGFRQGSPEASFIFALVIADMLQGLEENGRKMVLAISWGTGKVIRLALIFGGSSVATSLALIVFLKFGFVSYEGEMAG